MKKSFIIASAVVVITLVCAVWAVTFTFPPPPAYYRNKNTLTIIPSVRILYNGAYLTNDTVIDWGNQSIPSNGPFGGNRSVIILGYSYEKNFTIINASPSPVELELNVTGLPNGWSESWNLTQPLLPNTRFSTTPANITIIPIYYNYQLNANSTVVAAVNLWVPAGYSTGTYDWTSEIMILPIPLPAGS